MVACLRSCPTTVLTRYMPALTHPRMPIRSPSSPADGNHGPRCGGVRVCVFIIAVIHKVHKRIPTKCDPARGVCAVNTSVTECRPEDTYFRTRGIHSTYTYENIWNPKHGPNRKAVELKRKQEIIITECETFGSSSRLAQVCTDPAILFHLTVPIFG